MKIQEVDFKGLVKWLVTKEVIFVDPLFVDELHQILKNGGL